MTVNTVSTNIKYILIMVTNTAEVQFERLGNTKISLRLFNFRFRVLIQVAKINEKDELKIKNGMDMKSIQFYYKH